MTLLIIHFLLSLVKEFEAYYATTVVGAGLNHRQAFLVVAT